MNLTKQTFITAIEAIQAQSLKDNLFSLEMGRLLKCDDLNPYDTSVLTKTIISLLQSRFPKDENGHCDIEHYCYDLNFGKCGDDCLITPEMLWDRLIEDSYSITINDLQNIHRKLSEQPPKFITQVEIDTFENTISNQSKV